MHAIFYPVKYVLLNEENIRQLPNFIIDEKGHGSPTISGFMKSLKICCSAEVRLSSSEGKIRDAKTLSRCLLLIRQKLHFKRLSSVKWKKFPTRTRLLLVVLILLLHFWHFPACSWREVIQCEEWHI